MRNSEVHNVPIIRPNTTMSISDDSSKDKQLSMVAKSKQKATKRSIILEIFVLIFASAYTSTHFLGFSQYSHQTFLLYSLDIAGILSVIATCLWISFEIHKKSLILLIQSFKGFVIILSVVIWISCDVLQILSTSNSNSLITQIIINDLVCLSFLFILISSDCIPSITIFTRFIGPIFAILNGIKTLLIDLNNTDITIVNQIQQFAVLQMILFSALFVFGFIDIKHKYFVILNNSVRIKKLLPLRNYGKDNTFVYGRCSIKTSYIFICLTMGGILSFTAFIWNYLTHNYESLWCAVIWNGIALLLMLIILCILCWNYFEKSIIKHLLPQFRNNMLLVSIIVILYCDVQALIWNNSSGSELLFVINDALHSALYVIYVIFLVTSDVMKISYPIYFNVLLILAIMVISVWNLYMLIFNELYVAPKWFSYLKQEASLQVIVLCVLFLWNMVIGDRENKHFVLIRATKQCKELFYDESKQSEFPNNLVMDNDGIDSQKL